MKNTPPPAISFFPQNLQDLLMGISIMQNYRELEILP
jgi:hypothetical protein